MTRFINAVILLMVTFSCNLSFSQGYKWVTVKPGSQLPPKTVRLDNTQSYVGRAYQYNTLQPVEVVNSSYAKIFNTYSKKYDRIEQFEVLTATEQCNWAYFPNGFSDFHENLVLVGYAWNREPIYMGSRGAVASILMTSRTIKSAGISGYLTVLVCNNNDTWVDATPSQSIPKNAISFGGNGGTVARFLGPSTYFPASIEKGSKYCSTYYNQTKINSLSCQVLIGSSKEYRWEKPKGFGYFPDNAVVVGKNENNEIMYVGRDNGLLILTFSFFMRYPNFSYEILVKNV
ncbi:uncharacterized protein LOC129908654 [Episyrphus balteatus]|uniref:uncharacterized protein LOC129908654 n=1 Tax=Episyrphus balteatus TaxID=286459 RepID=UPI0024860C3C|nr:uncharacterized protein LOC129908654 [Episyrphus balteatus]